MLDRLLALFRRLDPAPPSPEASTPDLDLARADNVRARSRLLEAIQAREREINSVFTELARERGPSR